MLAVGTPAPAFSLPDQDGTVRTLADFAGAPFVLYFYPKDSTPGCTAQACGFTALEPDFSELGVPVVGVSKDSVTSHRRFADKNGLKLVLLSDPDLQAIQAYDVWHEKKLYGKASMGVVRTTYLVDAQGVIVAAHEKVKAAENPAQTLEELRALLGAAAPCADDAPAAGR